MNDLNAGRIFVGPIWAINKAQEIGARHAVTLINPLEMAGVVTPAHVAAEDHLRLEMNDIDQPVDGRIIPALHHVRALLDFLPRWDRQTPLLIHCRAGISRSPAAAFIVLCALNPGVDERRLARRLRAACALVNPNRRLVGLGDEALGRNGRMLAVMDEFADTPRHEEGVLFLFDAVSEDAGTE